MKPTIINFVYNGKNFRIIAKPREGEYVYGKTRGHLASIEIPNVGLEAEVENMLGDKIWAPLTSESIFEHSLSQGVLMGIMADIVARAGEGRIIDAGTFNIEPPKWSPLPPIE